VILRLSMGHRLAARNPARAGERATGPGPGSLIHRRPARPRHLGPGPSLPRPAAGLAELAGNVVIVAVAEAELDVVADVDFARAAAAVNQAGFLEGGPGGSPAGPGSQAGRGGSDQGPGAERRRRCRLDVVVGGAADTGTACVWAARHISYGPQSRLFGSFSWASMANASPNAFGAQLAFPGRQTIALCGDGGFTMLGLGDLLTEVQRHAPVVHVVLNNGMLDFVNTEQQEAGFIPYGTSFANPDFSRVAQALGATGIRIEEPGDVRDGLQAALAHKGGPVVVDVLVDGTHWDIGQHGIWGALVAAERAALRRRHRGS
jgi:hypothetical protein